MSYKFVVDFMLGRLCRWLRVIGYDAEYFTPADKNLLVYNALRNDRIVLTRDTKLSRKKTLRIILVSSNDFIEQIKQIVHEVPLEIDEKCFFTRCSLCNVVLEETDKAGIVEKVPSYVYKTQEMFSVCPNCKKIYWQGSHWELMKNTIKKIEGIDNV